MKYPREDFSDDMECFSDQMTRPETVAAKAAAALEVGHYDYYFQSLKCAARFPTLLQIAHRMSDADFWHYVRKFWNKGCDGAGGEPSDPEAFIEVMTGSRPNRQLLMRDHEHAVLAELGDEITVFRGCSKDKICPGWSWSLKEDLARKFAVKYRGMGDGVILKGRCLKKSVVAFFEFEGLNEQEIVTAPGSVYGLEYRPTGYRYGSAQLEWRVFESEAAKPSAA